MSSATTLNPVTRYKLGVQQVLYIEGTDLSEVTEVSIVDSGSAHSGITWSPASVATQTILPVDGHPELRKVLSTPRRLSVARTSGSGIMHGANAVTPFTTPGSLLITVTNPPTATPVTTIAGPTSYDG